MLTHVLPLNPKDQDLAGHAMSKFHLVSSLTFLKTTRTSKKLSPSHVPRVHTNDNFLPYFSLFSLKERARSSLQSMGSHTQRKIKLHLISSSYSLKETRKLKENSLKLSTSHTFRSSY